MAFGIGMVLGLINGLAHWQEADSGFRGSIKMFGRKVFWGTLELAFYVACIGVYCSLWRVTKTKSTGRLIHSFVAILGATNLLLSLIHI